MYLQVEKQVDDNDLYVFTIWSEFHEYIYFSYQKKKKKNIYTFVSKKNFMK